MGEYVLDFLLYMESFEIVRFACVGVLCMAVHGSVYVLCNEKIGLNYLLSFALGFIVALGLNFALNKFWTFHNPELDHLLREFALFTLKKFGFLGLGEVLLHYLVNRRCLNKRLAGGCVIVGLGPVSYLLSKLILQP